MNKLSIVTEQSSDETKYYFTKTDTDNTRYDINDTEDSTTFIIAEAEKNNTFYNRCIYTKVFNDYLKLHKLFYNYEGFKLKWGNDDPDNIFYGKFFTNTELYYRPFTEYLDIALFNDCICNSATSEGTQTCDNNPNTQIYDKFKENIINKDEFECVNLRKAIEEIHEMKKFYQISHEQGLYFSDTGTLKPKTYHKTKRDIIILQRNFRDMVTSYAFAGSTIANNQLQKNIIEGSTQMIDYATKSLLYPRGIKGVYIKDGNIWFDFQNIVLLYEYLVCAYKDETKIDTKIIVLQGVANNRFIIKEMFTIFYDDIESTTPTASNYIYWALAYFIKMSPDNNIDYETNIQSLVVNNNNVQLKDTDISPFIDAIKKKTYPNNCSLACYSVKLKGNTVNTNNSDSDSDDNDPSKPEDTIFENGKIFLDDKNNASIKSLVKLDNSNRQFKFNIDVLVQILSEKNEGYVKTVETLTNFVIIVGDKLNTSGTFSDKNIIMHKRIENIMSIGNEINKINNENNENSYPDINTFFTGYESKNNKIVNNENRFEDQIPNFIAYISLFIRDEFRDSNNVKKLDENKKNIIRNAFILIEHTPKYVTDFVNNHKYKQSYTSHINPALHFINYFNGKITKITKIMKYLLHFPSQ